MTDEKDFDWDNAVAQYRNIPLDLVKKPPTAAHKALNLKKTQPKKKQADNKAVTHHEEEKWIEFKSSGGKTIWLNSKYGEVRNTNPDSKEAIILTGEDILNSLVRIERQVKQILDQSHSISSLVCEDLREIKARVENVHKEIQGGSLDDRNDVESLIEFNDIQCKWDNPHVHNFRRQAVEYDHTMLFQEWHIPQNYSRIPLPGLGKGEDKTILVHVNLPKVQPIENTKVPITMKDTVDKAIHMAYSKCKAATELGPENQYVLKAEGLQDYMRGSRSLFDYEYVRQCVRDGADVKLSLVKCPDVQEWNPDVDLEVEFHLKVKETLKPLPGNSWRGISSNTPFYEMTAFPMSEMHIPLTVKVLGVDNCNADSLPKAKDAEGATHYYLKMFVFHGITKLGGTEKDTQLHEMTSELRFNWTLQTDMHVRLSTLPRESRIVFQLWCKATEKDVMVAWVVQQLVDDRGVLISGRRALNMWPIVVGGKGHGKKKRDLGTEFIYHASNRDNHSDERPVTLTVQFDKWELPVVAPLTEKYRAPDPRVVGPVVPMKNFLRSNPRSSRSSPLRLTP